MTARFETLARLGTGGMATVYLARARGALGFQRLVALKRAHPHVRDDPELRESLRIEAKLSGRLRHPNVVSVLDVHESSEGEIELVLDYVEGATLSDLLSAGPLPAAIALRVVLDVAAGLGAAHDARADDGSRLDVVHRDVTPSNVLVGTDGIARIADFGIARANEREGARTSTGVLKGKVGYMAPEYVERYRADAASDQFSLAVVAWESLSGERLFKGPTELETMKRVVAARVPSLAAFRPELAPLEPVLARALARDPSARFPGVHTFASQLEQCARSLGLLARYEEVAHHVAVAASSALAARRAAIAGKGDDSFAGARARDEVATASIVASPGTIVQPIERLSSDQQPRPSEPGLQSWTHRKRVGFAFALAFAAAGSLIGLGMGRSTSSVALLPDASETGSDASEPAFQSSVSPSDSSARSGSNPASSSRDVPVNGKPQSSKSSPPPPAAKKEKPVPVPTRAPPNPYKESK